MRKIIRILIKILLYGLTSILTVIFVVLLVFWLEHIRSLTLPKPSGSYNIGRTSFDWTDSSRVDSLAPLPNVKRELTVWIWYPASDKKSYSTVEYLPQNWQKALTGKQGFIMTNLFTKSMSKVHPHATANPELSHQKKKYPLVILKSGIGALAIDYTTLAEDLASHGYIVVGNDSPYSTFIMVYPDGRVIERTAQGSPGEMGTSSVERVKVANHLVHIWSDDTKFILDKLEQLNLVDSLNRFFGKLDLNSIGIFGHSFGGATAAQFCLDDPRCKAGIDMDGAPFGTVVEKGLKKPFMFILGNHRNENDPLSNLIKANIKSIFNSLADSSRVWISLDGAKHFNFTDMALTKERIFFRFFGATGPIGSRHGLEVEAACVNAFFDVYLNGRPDTEIDNLVKQYPEVKISK